MNPHEAKARLHSIRLSIRNSQRSYARHIGRQYPTYPKGVHPDDIAKIDGIAQGFDDDLTAIDFIETLLGETP